MTEAALNSIPLVVWGPKYSPCPLTQGILDQRLKNFPYNLTTIIYLHCSSNTSKYLSCYLVSFFCINIFCIKSLQDVSNKFTSADLLSQISSAPVHMYDTLHFLSYSLIPSGFKVLYLNISSSNSAAVVPNLHNTTWIISLWSSHFARRLLLNKITGMFLLTRQGSARCTTKSPSGNLLLGYVLLWWIENSNTPCQKVCDAYTSRLLLRGRGK